MDYFENPEVFCGKVVRKKLGRGSKKEEMISALLMDNGGELVLRRNGFDPFMDEILAAYEGKTIKVNGTQQSYVLIVNNVIEVV
jgi:hypothetical protein